MRQQARTSAYCPLWSVSGRRMHATADRYGHLYDAARDRLRDHLDTTYADTAAVHTSTG
jgi:hypothetical protein